MLTQDLVDFFASGCGLLIGTVGTDGTPHATRAWGAEVTDPLAGRIHLIVPGDDPVLLDHLEPGAHVAVTAAHVRTLRSVQVKGSVVSVGPPSDADRARAASHSETFFTSIHELDGNPRELLERLAPTDFTVCDLVVTEIFDQTPGPRAGTRVEEPSG